MNSQTGLIRFSITATTLAVLSMIFVLDSPAAGMYAMDGWWQGRASSQMAFGVLGQSLPTICVALGILMLTALWRLPSR